MVKKNVINMKFNSILTKKNIENCFYIRNYIFCAHFQCLRAVGPILPSVLLRFAVSLSTHYITQEEQHSICKKLKSIYIV